LSSLDAHVYVWPCSNDCGVIQDRAVCCATTSCHCIFTWHHWNDPIMSRLCHNRWHQSLQAWWLPMEILSQLGAVVFSGSYGFALLWAHQTRINKALQLGKVSPNHVRIPKVWGGGWAGTMSNHCHWDPLTFLGHHHQSDAVFIPISSIGQAWSWITGLGCWNAVRYV
jgi:hypothetical protein